MKKLSSPLLFIFTVGITIGCNPEKKSGQEYNIQPPAPEKIPYELAAHGTKRIDNYYWMKLSEDQKNASTRDKQTHRSVFFSYAVKFARPRICFCDRTCSRWSGDGTAVV